MRGGAATRSRYFFDGYWAPAPRSRMMSRRRAGYLAFTFCWTSAGVFDEATAASKARR